MHRITRLLFIVALLTQLVPPLLAQSCRYFGTLSIAEEAISVDFGPDGALWVFHRSGRVACYDVATLDALANSSSSGATAATAAASPSSPTEATATYARPARVTDGRVINRDGKGFPYLLRRNRQDYGFEILDTRGEVSVQEGLIRRPLPRRIVRSHSQGALLDDKGGVWLPGQTEPLVDLAGATAVAQSADGRWAALVDDQLRVASTDGRVVETVSAHGRARGFLNDARDLLWWGERVVVCDHGNHRLQLFSSKPNDGKAQRVWGRHAALPREGEGALHYPLSLALYTPVDGTPRLAVLEEMENRVQIFELHAADQAVVLAATAGEDLHFGKVMTADESLLAVSEEHEARILLYDLRHDDPIRVGSFGGWGSAVGEFRSPGGMLLEAAADRLWIADNGNRRLQSLVLGGEGAATEPVRFDPFRIRLATSIDLERLWQLRKLPKPVPEIVDVARGADDVLVLLAAEGSIFEFDAEWNVVAHWSVGDAASAFAYDTTADRWGVVDPQKRELLFCRRREVSRRLAVSGHPWGVTVTADSVWYVSDREQGSIWRCEADADELQAWVGTPGFGAGEFHKPTSLLTVIRNGVEQLIICDHGNHRGQIIDLDGEFQRAFGARAFVRPTQKR